MPNNYFTGQGTILRRGQTIPAPATLAGETSFNNCAFIKELTPPAIVKTSVEFNVLDVAGALSVSGGREPAEVTFTLALDFSKAETNGIREDALLSTALSLRVWEIVLPNPEATTIRFFGEVTSYEPSTLTPADVSEASVTIKLSGDELYTV